MVYLIKSLPSELNDDIIILLNTVDLALQFERFWAASKIYSAASAASAAKVHVPEEILMKIVKYLPHKEKEYVFRCAVFYGFVKVVNMLLADPSIDDKDIFDFAIYWASRKGNSKVVQLLLSDSRVDPSIKNNAAIRWASRNGKFDVVKLLFSDPRVDPSSKDNEAIRWASINGHSSTVELLLADPRVDPSANNNEAISVSSFRRHNEVVQLLLSDPRVDIF